MSWSVTSTYSPSVDPLVKLLNYKYNTSTDELVTVPASFLVPGAIFEFTLQLTNYLGATTLTKFTVEAMGDDIALDVQIFGPSTVSSYRWKQISLQAMASILTCAADDTGGAGGVGGAEAPFPLSPSVPIDLEWFVFSGSDLQLQGNLKSSSLAPQVFKLPAYSLEPSTSYTVQVVAKIPNPDPTKPPIRASSSVVIQVGAGSVETIIKGGSMRVVMIDTLFDIDASLSYAHDYPVNSAALSYSWECKETLPVYNRYTF